MTQRRPDRTLGPGHDEFWQWCNQRELRLQRCVRCSHLCWPVVRACDQCGSEAFAWESMSGRGKIVSWCTFERDYYHGALPLPWDNILVELAEGPLFLSNPQGFACRDIDAGMPAGMAVRVDFIECEDSAGRFNLPVFVPA
jgi:uncharacterized protein